MKFLFTNRIIDQNLSKDFENLTLRKIGGISLIINDLKTITETENLISITDGYLRDPKEENLLSQNGSAARFVFKNWPVDDNITGSFSSLIFEKKSQEIVLTSDLCNIYPIYYLIQGGHFYYSNSIILLGRYSNAELDKTGIFQRATGPNFSNIGSRTILSNCKRLLPGEWIKFNSEGRILKKKYDNSLYQNIGSASFTNSDIKEYWIQYKKEVELCVKEYKEVNIALSGGIDSRIVLGAIPESHKISAKTFGHSKNYESRIASRLAKIKGASHKCYYDLDKYFPEKRILQDYSRLTEAVKLNSWLELLYNNNPSTKEPLLLGELCEGLPGRNIKKFSSSKFRYKNFFKFYIRNQPFPLKNNTQEIFDEWKKSKTDQILSWHDDNWFKKLNLLNYKDLIISSTTEDANEIFDRIDTHNLKYIELFDELFSWYTYTRMELSRQVNICNEKYYAFSPGMSIQMLRKTSNIHPNNRLYYRFANKLLKIIPELWKFTGVPTSQIPIIPQDSPNILKIPVWGIRSKIDDLLVKRLMKSKDKNKRYRLLESINWVKVYQQERMLKNIQDYYTNNHLSESYFRTFYDLAVKRNQLKKWPFANMDIISGAALNAEIDLIKNYPE